MQQDEYSVRMNTAYADRIIGHLTDTGMYCSSCQDKCITCRGSYDLDLSKSIAGIINVPSVLPAIVDDPEEYLPEQIPYHDILIAVSVHEELIAAFIEKFSGSKGVIVPIEESDWISPHAISRITHMCREKGIEYAFPKPFCSFAPQGGVLADFRKEFRIGRPEVNFTVTNGIVEQTEVVSSAPCGATYYVARNLEKRAVNDKLFLKGDMLLSAYPCTADHSLDREFNDSITHEAVKIQRQQLAIQLQKYIKKEKSISV
jgi:hypothetical protein